MLTPFKWKSLFAFAKTNGRANRKTSSLPNLESLEDRLTPSGTPTDLTTHGAAGTVSGAIFRQFDAQPTGTGVIESFVRLQSNKSAVQQGYNSDHRPVQFDENKSPQFTRSLRVDSVPVVEIGGTRYREFLLDINQKASQPLLSLDELRIYVGDSSGLSGYNETTHQFAGTLNPVYDLDAGGDNWIKLNSRLNQGSGKGDMLAYIPDSAFAGGTYVYLYSKFGVNNTPNAGFEEWAAGSTPLSCCTSGSISGKVVDQDNNGVYNVQVFLDANHNGIFDNNEVVAYTDISGNYRFDSLATGPDSTSYYVTVVPPEDYTPVSPLTSIVSLETCGQLMLDLNFQLQSGPPNS